MRNGPPVIQVPPQQNDDVCCVGNCIITHTGRVFDLANLWAMKPHPKDIAFALSNIARFGGHCSFYSVAEHSYLCSVASLILYPTQIDLAYSCLMHDATEAYIGDVPKPLKLMLPDYNLLEEKLDQMLSSWFNYNSKCPHVKIIDRRMFFTEHNHFFPDTNLDIPGKDTYPPFTRGISIQPMSPDIACRQWMAQYLSLRNQLGLKGLGKDANTTNSPSQQQR